MAKPDTKAALLARAQREKVKFMRLQFTDILGVIKNVEVPDRQFDEALDGRIMFDGSSIEGFVRIEESDMLLRPDPSTFQIFPWSYDSAERVDSRWDVGQRIELADEARDFLLGAVLGSGQHLRHVVGGEVRAEHQQGGEVELACGNRVEQGGKAAHEARGGDAAVGFVFGEAQFVDAVDVEARACADAVDTAGLHLGEVGEQGRQELVRTTDESSRGGEELAVGELSGEGN